MVSSRNSRSSATLNLDAPSQEHGSTSYRPGGRRSRSPEEEQAPSQQGIAVSSNAPLLPPSPTGVGGWLARFVGSKRMVVPAVLRPDMSKDQMSDVPTVQRATYNADEYNWSGFSCPYCAASNFVSRWGGHLVCDGSSELRNGQKFHQCFCGHAGPITGTIKTVESKRLSVEEKLGPPNPLPPITATWPNSRAAQHSPRYRRKAVSQRSREQVADDDEALP